MPQPLRAPRSIAGVPTVLLLVLALGLWLGIGRGLGGVARAEGLAMEIVPLRHRTVAEILPILQPLVAPGGGVSGMNDQLVIRATPANLAQIKGLLAGLDTPARRLRIAVEQGTASQGSGGGVGIQGGIGYGGGGEVPRPGGAPIGQAFGGQTPGGPAPGRQGIGGQWGGQGPGRWRGGVGVDLAAQQVQSTRGGSYFVDALEGQPAFIQVGSTQALPIATVTPTYGGGAVVQQTTTLASAGSGFYVRPRLNGNRVTLEILPSQAAFVGPGQINYQGAETTVAGQLGEWIQIGGVSEGVAMRSRGPFSTGGTQGSSAYSVRVKVEELP
jgi:type II secretory pathway component GspD/PulD (secretin)